MVWDWLDLVMGLGQGFIVRNMSQFKIDLFIQIFSGQWTRVCVGMLYKQTYITLGDGVLQR